MKLSKIALTVIVAAAVATPALRASAAGSGTTAGPYLTLDGGVNIMQDVTVESRGFSDKVKMDTGFRVGLIGGYNLNSWAALELESGFMYNGLKDNASKNINDMWFGAIPVLGNVVFRFENSSGFVPYIGAGAGGAYTMVRSGHHDDGSSDDQSDFVFAYQGKVGVAYQISPCMAVDVGYKFFGTAQQNYDRFSVKDVYAHFIGLSLTWKF
jgi:opacity protein-like surface antigen